MVRTQIQLTDEQAQMLKQLAAEKGLSMAELIRRSVNEFITSTGGLADRELRERALSVIGIASSGEPDLGQAHDRHLQEIYRGEDR